MASRCNEETGGGCSDVVGVAEEVRTERLARMLARSRACRRCWWRGAQGMRGRLWSQVKLAVGSGRRGEAGGAVGAQLAGVALEEISSGGDSCSHGSAGGGSGDEDR